MPPSLSRPMTLGALLAALLAGLVLSKEEDTRRRPGPEGAPDAELGAMRDPEVFRSYSQGSRLLRTGAEPVPAPESQPPRKFPFSPLPDSPRTQPPPPAKPAPSEPATLEDVASLTWGRELLNGILAGPPAAAANLRGGGTLSLHFAELSPSLERANTAALEKDKRIEIRIARDLRGTRAEATTKIHELSHVLDLIERPDVRPETMGLLMERKANLYEVAAYLEGLPDIRLVPAPKNFYELEIWFKARVFADRLDRSFLMALRGAPAAGQARERANQVLRACKPRRPCGGTEALYRFIVAPAYEGTPERNILDKPRSRLSPEDQLTWDRAVAYRASLEELDQRIRRRFGLELQ